MKDDIALSFLAFITTDLLTICRQSHNTDVGTEDRKSRAVFYNLETARADIERTIDDSDSREHWRTLVPGVLTHWLGLMYDEGVGTTADLESAVNILRQQLDTQRALNRDLKAELAKCKVEASRK